MFQPHAIIFTPCFFTGALLHHQVIVFNFEFATARTPGSTSASAFGDLTDVSKVALRTAVKTMLKAHSNVGFADIDDVTLEATDADAEWGVKAGVSVSTKTVTESTINE